MCERWLCMTEVALTLFEGVEGRRVRVFWIALIVIHVHRQRFDVCYVGPVEEEHLMGVIWPVLVLWVQWSRLSLSCSSMAVTYRGVCWGTERHIDNALWATSTPADVTIVLSTLARVNSIVLAPTYRRAPSCRSGHSVALSVRCILGCQSSRTYPWWRDTWFVKVSLHTLGHYTLGNRQKL